MLEYAGTWSGTYLLRRGLFLPHELDQIIDGDLAREGMRRLRPLRRVAGALSPDPGTDSARVCALESSQYLRNQLLRDADWAGMAHSLEIRVPFVDVTLLRALAPVIGGIRWGAGKAALANAPVEPLPAEVVNRSKTGFGVPTASWMNATVARAEYGFGDQLPVSQGLASRRWARIALAGWPIQSRELRTA
jgi:asparagine synthase (glutamine-hydrolysing)